MPHSTLASRLDHTRRVLARLKAKQAHLERYLATLEEQRRKSPGWCYQCGDYYCHENPNEGSDESDRLDRWAHKYDDTEGRSDPEDR